MSNVREITASSIADKLWGMFRKKPVPPPPPPPIPNDVVEQLVAAMNAERAKSGLNPLVRHPSLDTSAQWHCNKMVETEVFSHQCPGESYFDQRITQAGYTPWAYVSENIAAGLDTADKVVAKWMDERPPMDGHRRSILGPAVHVGCGFSNAPGTKWQYYWTADFGTLRRIGG